MDTINIQLYILVYLIDIRMNYYQWGGFNSIYLRINTFNGITVRFLSNVPILSLDNVEVIDD